MNMSAIKAGVDLPHTAIAERTKMPDPHSLPLHLITEKLAEAVTLDELLHMRLVSSEYLPVADITS